MKRSIFLILIVYWYNVFSQDCIPNIFHQAMLGNDIFESICNQYNDNLILVLDENFNGNSLDESIWQTHFPWNLYFGVCYYNNNNVKVEDGILKLTAKQDPGYYDIISYDDGNYHTEQMYFKYTSGMIYSKKQFSYGVFKIRCRWPQVRGLWPTFWLFGGDKYDELDIFDNGTDTNVYICNILHHSDYYSNIEKICSSFDTILPSNFFNQWHIYTCYYYNDKIIIQIDNLIIKKFYRFFNTNGIDCEQNITIPNSQFFLNDAYPIRPMNIISSLQIAPWYIIDNIFPESTMEIDYIKVWQFDHACCMPYKLYESTENLPYETSMQNFIKAGNDVGIPNINGDVIVKSNQNVTFKAGDEIDLLPGFTAESGSNFSAEIQECNYSTKPEGESITIINIPNSFSPDCDGINDQLCVEVNGADYYDIYVRDYADSNIIYYFNEHVPIYSNIFCVWDIICNSGYSICNIDENFNILLKINFIFYNCSNRKTVTKNIYLNCSNKKSENDSCFNYNIEALNSDGILNNLELNISPNPTFDNTNISFNLCESLNIHMYITNLNGTMTKEILNQKYNAGLYNINIDVSNLAPGTYFCVLETSYGINKIKFIKM